MSCSVGEVITDPCETGFAFFNLSSFTELKQKIISERVSAEIRNPAEVTSLCSKHFLRFDGQYEEQQHDITGCCNLINRHDTPCKTDLRKITDRYHAELTDRFPYALYGRQICESCLDIIRGKQLEPIPQPYSFEYVQSLYANAMEHHGTRLEEQLKQFQAETIYHLLNSQDVICVLRTNYGKTLAMTMPSFIKAKLQKRRSVTLIISPLQTLMADLVRRLKAWNLVGLIMTKTDALLQKEIDSVPANCPVFLIASPEQLGFDSTRELLANNSVDFVVVDECHVSCDWGKDFRVEYANIHELRQFVTCPMGLFTATLTHVTKNQVIKNTGIRKDSVVEITDSPNRPEIFLETRKRHGIKESLKFLADEANALGLGMQKTLVFVKSINKTHEFNILFRSLLTNNGRVLIDGVLCDYLSEHFSASTSMSSKQRITQDFGNENGLIRVLFSTISYGMGIDNKSVHRVVLWDIDNEPSPVWQKISRICRDGNKGTAILFKSSVRAEASLLKPDACIRHSLLKGFIGYTLPYMTDCTARNSKKDCPLYLCCTFCRAKCICTDEYMEVC